MKLDEQSVMDVIGIGVGPSNLALAISLEEADGDAAGAPHTMHFFEKQASFSWHRGMLLEGATMQVSFLKDLVTMRNPMSPYTFMSYLKSKGRIAEFINTRTLFPFRVEFHDYLTWVAHHFNDVISYGAEVVRISPVVDDGLIGFLDLEVRFGGSRESVIRRTRNLVIGTGLAPKLPAGIEESPRIWHSSGLLERVEEISPGARRLVVVGAGQSAAEVVEYFHGRFPEAEVHAVFSRYGYSVADDSPFTNAIFDPKAVDEFFVSPPDLKKRLIGYHGGTNYSVVDLDLSTSLYRASYQEHVLGNPRLLMRNMTKVVALDERADRVEVALEYLPNGRRDVIEADAVVFATGYQANDPFPLLKEIASECKIDTHGQLVLERDYRVSTSDSVKCGIYLHGAVSEHTHGLAAGLLSNTAVRAGEIADSISTR
ncbi:lysine N(6)-hydroxylase/L-ornithine N(5)-oxygenase family protein [Streptomyces europaeiscabiei]|uniref:lysine N(6)-hydroxylase/L-ornithine N(5)-oxygenase family protein n=1 Tax=Streptomyces europaeiscabiei TaxID=146819 RepID=UPI0029B6E919|nr:SidA/IucD/PvdA family monooxygenase [Streptomyces europaeiscabiei]MDX3583352.1 SidA/IucD/PvdA family monooxygenase [Streptomyces europaeiscabiei]